MPFYCFWCSFYSYVLWTVLLVVLCDAVVSLPLISLSLLLTLSFNGRLLVRVATAIASYINRLVYISVTTAGVYVFSARSRNVIFLWCYFTVAALTGGGGIGVIWGDEEDDYLLSLKSILLLLLLLKVVLWVLSFFFMFWVACLRYDADRSSYFRDHSAITPERPNETRPSTIHVLYVNPCEAVALYTTFFTTGRVIWRMPSVSNFNAGRATMCGCTSALLCMQY